MNLRNQLFSLIPAGLTRIVQPLDVKINIPFKQKLKQIYDKTCKNICKYLDNIKRDIILD